MQSIWTFIERLFGVIAVLALLALVALPFLQVVMRDAFDAPIAGLEEATRWGLIGLVYLALPLLVSTNGNIRFSELVDRLPRAVRVALERVHLLVAALVLVVLANAAVGSALQNASNRTPMLNIPFLLFIGPMVVGLSVTALGAAYFGLRRRAPRIEPPEDAALDRDPEL